MDTQVQELPTMPAFEQHQPSDRPAVPPQTAPGFHSTLHETWGPGAVKSPEPQPSSALDGFNQFCIGFGAGFGNFAIETTKAAGQAIAHPEETIHNAVDGSGKALHAASEAAVAGSSYVANKVSYGDVAGMANDAVQTGQAIGSGIAQSVDHFNHLSAKEKGYIFGHDVAPTVVGTMIAPELLPEGAAAAVCGKVVSALGTLAKEEGLIAKVASTFESATEKIQAISEKLAALNDKMHTLAHGDKGMVQGVGRDSLNMPEVPKHLKHLELQKATPELLDAMTTKDRAIHVVKAGSEEFLKMEKQKVDGVFLIEDGSGINHIWLKENPNKITALEEFLHGTQKKLGMLDKANDDRLKPEMADARKGFYN
jgi:hypothetical protein